MRLPTAYLEEFAEPPGYLDFAAIGPPSRRVRRAVDGFLATAADPDAPMGSIVLGRYEEALTAMGRLVGVPAERVTVVPSTSAGLFQAAFGLVGRGPERNVVLPAHEFPANVYPWLRAEAVGGPRVRLVEVPDARVTPGALAQAVDDATVAIAVSLVDYSTGFRVDVPALKELAGDALLVVDAIQGLGAVRAALAPADVLVAGGQKWLRAGWGAGIMAASPEALALLEPTLGGWWAVEEAFDFTNPPPHDPRSDAERFHEGSPNLLGAIAAGAAAELVDLAGPAVIEQEVLIRSAQVVEVARRRGARVRAPWRDDAERAGIVTLRVPDEDAATTVTRLADAGFVVSERAGWLRVAPHATTPPGAIDALGEAL